jgi:DNA invertase Pin-like site-specific DNA recombinase
MADARKRRFDAVCVWKLDRRARSVADSIKSIQELTSLGVRFVAVTQNIETRESNPMARFLLHMAALAELEREIIRERLTREGGAGEREDARAAETRLPARRGDADVRGRRVLAEDRGGIGRAGDDGGSGVPVVDSPYVRCRASAQVYGLRVKWRA